MGKKRYTRRAGPGARLEGSKPWSPVQLGALWTNWGGGALLTFTVFSVCHYSSIRSVWNMSALCL